MGVDPYDVYILFVTRLIETASRRGLATGLIEALTFRRSAEFTCDCRGETWRKEQFCPVAHSLPPNYVLDCWHDVPGEELRDCQHCGHTPSDNSWKAKDKKGQASAREAAHIDANGNEHFLRYG